MRRFRPAQVWTPALEFVNAVEQILDEREGDIYVDDDGRATQRVRFSHKSSRRSISPDSLSIRRRLLSWGARSTRSRGISTSKSTSVGSASSPGRRRRIGRRRSRRCR